MDSSLSRACAHLCFSFSSATSATNIVNMFIFCWLWGGIRVAEGVAEVAIERFFNAKSRFLHIILHKSNLIFIAQPTKKAVNAQPEASAWLGLTTD